MNHMIPQKFFVLINWFIVISFLLISFSVQATDASNKTQFSSDLKAVTDGEIDQDVQKMVGMDVVSNNNEELGEIDNLIVTAPDNILYAIVSVGGFLGTGDKLVAVPVANLTKTNDDKVKLNVTKEEIENAPEFRYTEESGYGR
ncbi:MAG: PRC-barrel domain-containing protein [Nitrosomonas sp.]|nr:PRC-barrel domain-containing protein [Nitrosomonas sp.]